jgi:hypothetical protein
MNLFSGSPGENRWSIFSVRVCGTLRDVLGDERMVEEVGSSVCEWKTSWKCCVVEVSARSDERGWRRKEWSRS